MPNWLSVVVVVVLFLAVGVLRESWRMHDLEGVSLRRDLALHRPFSPGERSPVARLAERLDGREHHAYRWGAGLTGFVDGMEVIIAEHEVPRRGAGRSSHSGDWYVIMACRVPGATAQAKAGDQGPQSSQVIREADWAAWRVQGILTSAKVDELLAANAVPFWGYRPVVKPAPCAPVTSPSKHT